MSISPPHHNSNSFNTTNSHNNVWNNCTIADDRTKILTWLSPLEPRLQHKEIQRSRDENVEEWVLETEEFKSWSASSGESGSENAVLFCYGGPGAGKTFISSLVIDRLGDLAKSREVTVTCFYFNLAARKEQSPASMLGAVLRQVVSGLPEVPEEIAQAYEGHKKVLGGWEPQLPDIVKMLQDTASIRPTFICIDALDKCVAGYQVKILDSLHQILQRSPGTRMFVTGTPLTQAEARERLPGRVTTICVAPGLDDVDPEKPNSLDQTSLWDAALHGDEEVVRTLLERGDVNPNSRDFRGQTPLYIATERGHEGVVKVLLELHGVNPNEPDPEGRTPLDIAAIQGNTGVAKILLGRDDAEPNKPNSLDRTPLWDAACHGHEGVVKTLLERGDVNPNSRDFRGQTPLYIATERGYERIVKILLGRHDINPNEPDLEGRTPLDVAAIQGNTGVAKILLGRDDVDPNKPNSLKRTPLWDAACHGHEGVVKTLLERGDVNPNSRDFRGQTPRYIAAERGHERIVGMLLRRAT